MNVSLDIVAVLPWDLSAGPLINSAAFLFRSVLGLLPWHLVAFLFSGILSHTLVLSVTLLSVLSVALLARNRVASLPGNLLAVLSGHLVADLLGGVFGVGNGFCSTILLWNLLTFLFGNLLTLLPWFIPALLFSINVGAFPLGYCRTRLFIPSVALLFISGVALLFLPVSLNRLLNISANFFIPCIAFIFVLSVTFLFILGLTLLFRYISAPLFRNSLNFGNLDIAALFLIDGGSERLLHLLAVLSRFISAFFLVHSGAPGSATKGNASK